MFTMKMTLKSTGQKHELKGKYQNIWEKLKNGELALTTEAWNYNHPLEIEEQLRFEEALTVNIALQPHVPFLRTRGIFNDVDVALRFYN